MIRYTFWSDTRCNLQVCLKTNKKQSKKVLYLVSTLFFAWPFTRTAAAHLWCVTVYFYFCFRVRFVFDRAINILFRYRVINIIFCRYRAINIFCRYKVINISLCHASSWLSNWLTAASLLCWNWQKVTKNQLPATSCARFDVKVNSPWQYRSLRMVVTHCAMKYTLSVAGVRAELGLKIRVYSVAHRLWSVIAPALGWKRYPTCYMQTVHSRASHMPISQAPHTCNYMGCVRHVGHAARESQKITVITLARIPHLENGIFLFLIQSSSVALWSRLYFYFAATCFSASIIKTWIL